MTPRGRIRDVPASIRQRLLNLAREQGIRFNSVLRRYAAERFLYRLSPSGEVNRFTLKGAALFRIWTQQEMRPTRDGDFLSVGPEDHAAIRATLATVCGSPCPRDETNSRVKDLWDVACLARRFAFFDQAVADRPQERRSSSPVSTSRAGPSASVASCRCSTCQCCARAVSKRARSRRPGPPVDRGGRAFRPGREAKAVTEVTEQIEEVRLRRFRVVPRDATLVAACHHECRHLC